MNFSSAVNFSCAFLNLLAFVMGMVQANYGMAGFNAVVAAVCLFAGLVCLELK